MRGSSNNSNSNFLDYDITCLSIYYNKRSISWWWGSHSDWIYFIIFAQSKVYFYLCALHKVHAESIHLYSHRAHIYIYISR